MSTDKKTIDWYNEHAEEYAAHAQKEQHMLFHSQYDRPVIQRLLPDLHGKQVLNLGCGSGDDSALLRSLGAATSVGIDISDKLIAIAKTQHPDCDFQVMDMEHLQFDDQSFDVAYAGLALHYLEDWSRAFTEVYRVLRPGGSFVFSCGHPLLSAMAITEETDEIQTRMLRVVKHKQQKTAEVTGDYFTRRIDTAAGDSMDVTIWHKPMSEIIDEATGAGFLLSALAEPVPEPAVETFKPMQYQMLSKIPSMLVIKLEKLS